VIPNGRRHLVLLRVRKRCSHKKLFLDFSQFGFHILVAIMVDIFLLRFLDNIKATAAIISSLCCVVLRCPKMADSLCLIDQILHVAKTGLNYIRLKLSIVRFFNQLTLIVRPFSIMVVKRRPRKYPPKLAGAAE